MKTLLFLFIMVFFYNCLATRISAAIQQSGKFKTVSIETLLNQKISIVAILTEKDLVYSVADQGRFGCFNLRTSQKIKTFLKEAGSRNWFVGSIMKKSFTTACVFGMMRKELRLEILYRSAFQSL